MWLFVRRDRQTSAQTVAVSELQPAPARCLISNQLSVVSCQGSGVRGQGSVVRGREVSLGRARLLPSRSQLPAFSCRCSPPTVARAFLPGPPPLHPHKAALWLTASFAQATVVWVSARVVTHKYALFVMPLRCCGRGNHRFSSGFFLRRCPLLRCV
jgi:hypothetical protein